MPGRRSRGRALGRREVLGTAVAVGAMVAAGRGHALAGPATGAPRTMAAVGHSSRGTHTPGFPIGHLGLTWTGDGCGWVRFEGAQGWGPWRPVTAGGCLGGDRPAALIQAGGASAYQASTAGDVQVVAINTTDDPPADTGILTRAGWGADETLRSPSSRPSPTCGTTSPPARSERPHHTDRSPRATASTLSRPLP